MTIPADLVLLATYNAWMNAKLYAAAATLAPEALLEDRKAFFGSIIGTLNHLVVADTIWVKRFASHPAGFASLAPTVALPAPKALNDILFTGLPALTAHRKMMDQVILAWVAELTEAHLETVLRYRNTRGIAAQKRFGSLLIHFFNHQTHHRGQLSTLLFQAGVDPGVTDLLMLIPNEDEI